MPFHLRFIQFLYLNDTNILWPLAGWLNNLLARVRHWRQDAIQLKYTREITQRLIQDIQIAKQQKQPFQLYETGTEIDPLLRELGYSIVHKEQNEN